MQTFTFNIDQKIQMWTRSTKHIEAETFQQAEKILKSQYFNGDIYEDLDEYNYLYDTQRDLDIVEILDEKGNLLDFNKQTIIL